MTSPPTLVRPRPEFELLALDRGAQIAVAVAKGLDGLSVDDVEDEAHALMGTFFTQPGQAEALAEGGIYPVETGIAPADFHVGSHLVRKGEWFLKFQVSDPATWAELTQNTPKETTVTKTKTPRGADEILADVVKLEKDSERYFDSRAERDIEAAAERLRKASGYTLGKAEAVAKALEQNPELYASYHRDLMRRQGVLDDRPSAIAKAEKAASRLEQAGERVRRAHPELTREQAVAKALEDDPSLYEATR